MKKSIIAGLSIAALGVTAGAAGASSSHSCGNVSQYTTSVKAYNVSCRTAKKIAKKAANSERTKPYKCKSKQTYYGASWTCRDGKRKITFKVSGGAY